MIKKVDKEYISLLLWGFAPAWEQFDIFVSGEFEDYANNQPADQIR